MNLGVNMETNTKDLFHNLVRFNLSGEYDFNIFLSFVQIVENAVGKVYYENLFLVYDAFNDLIQNYSNFKNLTMQNSSYLNLYNDCTQNLNQLSSQYKKSLKATVDELLDINYQENLSEKVEKLRTDINTMLDMVIQANEYIRPTAEFEPLINEVKPKLNNDIKIIKSSYKKLREMGELEFYSDSCKNQCKAEFFNYLNANNMMTERSNELFESLWNILNLESNILIDCANLAMNCAIKSILTSDEISDSEQQHANDLFNQYINLGSNLIELENNGIM